MATINDARSHGVVGDNLLSLNEAIQIYNRQLALHLLSTLELQQISGFGPDVDRVFIDGTVLPVITIERDLEPMLDLPHGLQINGANAEVVLDFRGANIGHGFRSAASLCRWHKLVIRGGPYAIDQVETNQPSTGAPEFTVVLDHVTFEGQGSFAVRKTLVGGPSLSRLVIGSCRFDGVPQALRVDERAPGWGSTLIVQDTEIRGGGGGIEVLLGMQGSGRFAFDRLQVEGTGTALRIDRPAGADRPISVAGTCLDLRGGSGLAIAGTPAADTALALYLLELHAIAPGKALALLPLGGRCAGELAEVTASGDVDVLTGGAPLPLSFWNVRMQNGTLRLGSTGTQPLLLGESRFDGCAIQGLGSAALQPTEWCIVGGSVQAQAPASIACTQSHLATTIGAGTSSVQPRPAQQLGSFTVQPATVRIGNPVVFQAALPPGLSGLFALGLTSTAPLLLPPFHVYMDPSATATIPGIYRLQQAFQFAIPNNANLIGTDLTAQMLVLPDPGVQAPPLQLPPGRRFVLT
jgi:hypothetical protein